MIGPKKLRTIRQELQRALAATGEDPIRWLEERMTACGRQGAAAAGERMPGVLMPALGAVSIEGAGVYPPTSAPVQQAKTSRRSHEFQP